MHCLVVLEVMAKAGTGRDLLALIREMLPDTRNKDGCQVVDVNVNQDDPDNVLLVMRWASRKHYETYYQGRVAKGDLNRLGEAIDGKPTIRFFDPTGI